MTAQTATPAHLLPVQRHLVEWRERDSLKRKPFTFRSEAESFQRELAGKGIQSRRLKV